MRTKLDPDGLRRELARRGLNQAELAAIAGVSETTLSHAMSRPVAWTTVRKLARALTVTPLLPGIDAIIPAKTNAQPMESGRAFTEEADRGDLARPA